MKLLIKQKLLALNKKFVVIDEHGMQKYTIEGEYFTFGNKLHILDDHGVEVAFLHQKFLTLIPRFFLTINGTQVAEITKSITLFHKEYTISNLNWLMLGDFLGHDYRIMKQNQVIAEIHKKWLSITDTYEVDVQDDANVLATVAVVLAIDCVSANAKSSSH